MVLTPLKGIDLVRAWIPFVVFPVWFLVLGRSTVPVFQVLWARLTSVVVVTWCGDITNYRPNTNIGNRVKHSAKTLTIINYRHQKTLPRALIGRQCLDGRDQGCQQCPDLMIDSKSRMIGVPESGSGPVKSAVIVLFWDLNSMSAQLSQFCRSPWDNNPTWRISVF